MKPLSPIERMIDQACGFDPSAPPPLNLREVANAVCAEVIGHLQAMYPEQWARLSQSCRRSLRGSIINNVVAIVPRYQPRKPPTPIPVKQTKD